MTRISKYRVEDKVLKKLYFLMFEIISNMDDEERFTGIMNELLSPTEKIMIVKRIAILDNSLFDKAEIMRTNRNKIHLAGLDNADFFEKKHVEEAFKSAEDILAVIEDKLTSQ